MAFDKNKKKKEKKSKKKVNKEESLYTTNKKAQSIFSKLEDDDDDDEEYYDTSKTSNNNDTIDIPTRTSVDSNIVVHSFIKEKNLLPPDGMDIFISNSILLAVQNDNFIPWFPVQSEPDSFIEEAIRESNSSSGFSDMIGDSGIIDL